MENKNKLFIIISIAVVVILFGSLFMLKVINNERTTVNGGNYIPKTTTATVIFAGESFEESKYLPGQEGYNAMLEEEKRAVQNSKSQKEKADLYLKHSEKRITEAKLLIDAENTEKVEETLDLYSNELGNVANTIKDLTYDINDKELFFQKLGKQSRLIEKLNIDEEKKLELQTLIMDVNTFPMENNYQMLISAEKRNINYLIDKINIYVREKNYETAKIANYRYTLRIIHLEDIANMTKDYSEINMIIKILEESAEKLEFIKENTTTDQDLIKNLDLSIDKTKRTINKLK